jgi:hypothetical protein
MAKGDPLSSHQQKIVDRYYEHLDTAAIQRLSELVSDLYLEQGTGKEPRLWESVKTALAKTPADPARVQRILSDRNVESLAKLIGELSTTKPTGGKPSQPAGVTQPPPAARTAGACGSPNPGAPGSTPIGATAGQQAGGRVSPTDTNPDGTPTEDVLKMALKAFRKRLKVTRLDEESKLGRSPLTGGKHTVVAIQPPHDYPASVWQHLAKQGKLKPAGSGMYQLVE